MATKPRKSGTRKASPSKAPARKRSGSSTSTTSAAGPRPARTRDGGIVPQSSVTFTNPNDPQER
jgi:hypothetical protein